MSPVKDERGRVVGVSTIARDHTAAKLLQQQRDRLLQEHQQARQQAEEAWHRAEESERFKDQFISIVSHEMRSPLTSIGGWLSLLRSGKLQEPDIDNALNAIGRGTDTLLRLVNDLMDVERIRTGKIHIYREEVDFHSVVAHAVQAVQPQTQEKSIRVNTKSVSNTFIVLGDASRLHQIILNLLCNAIKFTPQGGSVDVCVNSHVTEQGEEVELMVSDTGKGIAPEFLPYAFDQFRQEEEPHSRSYRGLGLGLYIVRELVELHGGTIQAESEGANTGATFRVRLPSAPPLQSDCPA
jgi:signal transduction histidine kinase